MQRGIPLPKPKTLFDFGVIVLIIKTLFSYSAILPLPDLAEEIFTVLASVLMLISIFKKKYSYRTLILYLAIVVLSMYTSFRVGGFTLMVTVITVLAIRGKNINKKLRFFFKWELFFVTVQMLAFVVSLAFGVSPFTWVQGRRCINFGFVHPNVMGVLLSNLFCLWLWNNFDKLKVRNVLIITALEAVLYLATGCRTALYLYIIFLILIGIDRLFKNTSKLYSFIAAAIIPVISAIILFAVANRSNPLSMLINKALTGRITYGAYAYENAGLTFWGQNVEFLSSVKWDEMWRISSFSYDCLYYFCLTKCGIFWLVLITAAFWKLSRLKDNKINIMLISFALYGITEMHGINCYMFFPLILTVFALDGKKKRKRHRAIIR